MWALLSSTSSAYACTLFSAAGSAVESGGTILTKNRDYIPQPQEIRIVHSGNYAYLGLFSQSADEKWYLRAGVNEKGLTAVTAMTSCLPQKIRKSGTRKAILSYVLKNCASVEEALQCTDRFYGPKFVMLADGKEIAQIEIGQNGQHIVQRTSNSFLCHTNFYLEPPFNHLNLQVGESSKTRYHRITQLLTETKQPFTLQKFYEFSQNTSDGLDNSLWRLGSDPRKSQTLASFIVEVTPDKKIHGFIKYRQHPHEAGQEKTLQFTEQNIIDNKI